MLYRAYRVCDFHYLLTKEWRNRIVQHRPELTTLTEVKETDLYACCK